jgi:hypothetical protein
MYQPRFEPETAGIQVALSLEITCSVLTVVLVVGIQFVVGTTGPAYFLVDNPNFDKYPTIIQTQREATMNVMEL